MLYILQMIVVYIFYNYTQALRHCDEDIRTRNIKIMAVPILCMEVAIVTNVLHKQFFYCNEQGQYVHGKAYLVTYIFTLICIAAVIINCFINQEEYQKNELPGDQGIPWSCIGLCYDTDEISICINDRIWVILRDYDLILGTL